MTKAILMAVAAMMLTAGGQVATPGTRQAALAADDLAWLAGRWESAEGARWTEEVWAAPRGGALLGLSRSGEGGAMREYEFLRIARDADGVLTYFASPGGRAAVPFRLTAQEASSATFANPAHDFPQLIRYRRDGDTLVATVSASDGSNAMSWTYRRVP